MPKATAVLFALLGAFLIGGGGWLLLLGGSPYYLLAGLALAAVALALLRRRPWALGVFALLLVLSLAWAAWEAGGLDWWALATRLDALFLLGLWLCLPGVRRALQPGRAAQRQGAMLGAALLATALVSVLSWFNAPHDVEGR